MRDRDEALARAIRECGGQYKLAALLGITQPAVSKWSRCPADLVHKLAALTGNKVTAQELRPDMFEFEAVG